MGCMYCKYEYLAHRWLGWLSSGVSKLFEVYSKKRNSPMKIRSCHSQRCISPAQSTITSVVSTESSHPFSTALRLVKNRSRALCTITSTLSHSPCTYAPSRVRTEYANPDAAPTPRFQIAFNFPARQRGRT